MKVSKMRESIAEARRFIKAAEECLKNSTTACNYIYSSKESGSARRASMDLTRKLAEMRKP